MADNTKMAITRKGLQWILMGFLVMLAGFLLMMGGGVKDPQVFTWAMFDFRLRGRDSDCRYNETSGRNG